MPAEDVRQAAPTEDLREAARPDDVRDCERDWKQSDSVSLETNKILFNRKNKMLLENSNILLEKKQSS